MDTFRARNPLRDDGHALIHLAYELTGDTRENGQYRTSGEEPWVTQYHPERLRWIPRIQALWSWPKGGSPTVWVRPATARVVWVLGCDRAATGHSL